MQAVDLASEPTSWTFRQVQEDLCKLDDAEVGHVALTVDGDLLAVGKELREQAPLRRLGQLTAVTLHQEELKERIGQEYEDDLY